MMIIIFSIIFAVLNALRGSGGYKFFNRPAVSLYMGIIAGIYTYSFNIGVIVFLGLWAGLAFGWGKYLNVISGNLKYRDEVEVKLIDRITTKIMGYPQDREHFIRWCFVAMSLRGLLFYPMFIALAFFNPYSLFYGLFTVLMGVVYWLARFAPEQHYVRCAESPFGGLLGLLICLTLMGV